MSLDPRPLSVAGKDIYLIAQIARIPLTNSKLKRYKKKRMSNWLDSLGQETQRVGDNQGDHSMNTSADESPSVEL